MLVSLSYEFNWHGQRSWGHAVRQAVRAYAVGLMLSTLILFLIRVLQPPFFNGEMMGKIAVQMVPAGIGAVVGAGQFAPEQSEEEGERRAVPGESRRKDGHFYPVDPRLFELELYPVGYDVP